jgi:SAM-dependent methyltransferase
VGALRKRIEWARQASAMRRVRTLEDLEAFVAETKPHEFLHYQRLAPQKRVEAESLLSYLELDVRGRRILDLGPGHGDALDVFREAGAASCSFVDYDPLFYTFNRLKGYEGYRFNFRVHLRRLPRSSYDFIYIGQSITHANFRVRRAGAFRRWLRQLRGAGTTDAVIAVCPWWPDTGDNSREALSDHWFSRSLAAEGFRPVPWIEGQNKDVIYPLTFVFGRGPHGAGPDGGKAHGFAVS